MTSSPSGTLSPGCSDSEPASLAVGTEVSAKYKGAFCEAKIKCVTRLVKCRVTPKNGGSAIVVTDDNIKGPLRVGAIVEVRPNSSSSYIEATVNKIMDSSQYTVIFDDGDETTLKRTSLCLKSGKHYSESESLDHLPLTNPEQFCNPVGLWPRKRRRPGERSSSNVPMYQNRDSASIPYSNPPSVSDEDSTTGTIDGDDDSASNLTQRSVAKDSKDDSDSLRKDETLDVGKVFIIEYGEKRGNKAKDVWYPALVVNPTTPENTSIKIDPEHEYLVKSFKDNKFYCVSRRDVKEFVQETYCSSLNDANSSAALRSAVDKSISYLDRGELPSTWDSDLLLGPFASSDSNVATHDTDTNYTGMASSESDSVADDEYDDEKEKYEQPSELKDRFVAQLYKYMDERGTPINKAPSVNGKDLDLYRLFNIVHKMGGYNRVTSKDNWRQVYFKADLPSCPTQSLENNAVNQLKAAYKKYLLNFTDFYKKLGYSSSFISSPSSGRGHRRFGNWKGATSDSNATSNESTSQAKSRRKSNTEVDVKTEPNDDSQESEKVRDDEDKGSTRRGSLKKQPKKPGPGRKKAPVKAADAPANDSDDGLSESVKTPGPSVESDTDSELSSVQSIGKDVEVVAGDKIRVRYKKGSGEHVYEAKIVKAEKQVETGKMRFFVHYNGWNTRYDEWIYRSRIIEVIREKSPKRRSGNASNKFSKRAPPNDATDVADSKTGPPEQINTPKRGRPPSASGSKPPPDPNKSTSVPNAKIVPKVAASSSSSSSVSSKKLRSRADQSDTEQSDSTTVSKEEKCTRSETSSSDAAPEKTSGPATSLDDSEAKHNLTERRSSVDSSIKQDSNAGLTKEESKSKKDSSSKDGKKDPPDSNDSADEEDVSKGSHKRKRKDKKVPAEDTPKKKTKGFRGARSVKEEPAAESETPKSKERTSSFSSKKRKLETATQPASPAAPAAVTCTSTAAATTTTTTTTTTAAATTVVTASATTCTSSTVTAASSTTAAANAPPESSEDFDCKLKRKGRGLTKESILRADAKHKAEAARKASEKTIKKNTLVATEEDSRADDEDVNMEIARLFNEDKEKEAPTSKKEVDSTSNSSTVKSASSPQTGQALTCDPPEVSGSFLLCKEEVPLSPIPLGFSENAEPEVSSSSKPSQAISSSSSSANVMDVNAAGASGSNNGGEGNSANVQGNSNNTNNNSTNFTPPTTPESLRSGTLSSLTPPHERESQDMGHSAVKSQASHSASNSDGEAGDNRQKNSGPFGSPAHLSDDSCSRGVTETNAAGPSSEQGRKGKDAQGKCSAKDGLTSSPKRKRRGRARTSSTSECNNQQDTSEKSKKPDKHAGYKTRGSSNKRGANRSGYHEHDRYSPIGSTSDHANLHPISPVSGISPGDYTPNAFFKDIHPTSKYNFCTPIDETLDAERRILILNERICELRKTYAGLRSDLVSLERRKKKLKRKDRSNGCSPRNESDRLQKTLDRSVSGEFSSDASDLTRPATEVSVG